MRFLRSVILLLLSYHHAVESFRSCSRCHIRRQAPNRRFATLMEEEAVMIDQHVEDHRTARYLAEIHRFHDLAISTYKQQHIELQNIAAALQSIHTGEPIVEWDERETVLHHGAATPNGVTVNGDSMAHGAESPHRYSNGHHNAGSNGASVYEALPPPPSRPPPPPQMLHRRPPPIIPPQPPPVTIQPPPPVSDIPPPPSYPPPPVLDWKNDATTAAISGTMPTVASLVGSTFQLEELEDRESCSTELTLEQDHTLTLGDTDGPLYSKASGVWSLSTTSPGEEESVSTHSDDNPKQLLDMTITRTFDAGQKAREATDMGEFSFSVERAYLGDVTMVGDRLAVTGTIHLLDDLLGDQEIGYFNLIDNREETAEDRQFLYGRSVMTG